MKSKVIGAEISAIGSFQINDDLEMTENPSLDRARVLLDPEDDLGVQNNQ